MNRAIISLGVLLLLSISFVEVLCGRIETTPKFIKAMKHRTTLINTLPEQINLLDVGRDFSYSGVVGKGYHFLVLAEERFTWSIVTPPRIHTITAIKLFRSFGHSQVADLYSFSVTTTTPGAETIQIQLKYKDPQMYGNFSALQTKNIIIEAVAAQPTVPSSKN